MEREACHRLELLERKLTNTKDYDQVSRLRSDVDNLLEVIRRSRVDRRWNSDGLTFNEITEEDIFGPPKRYKNALIKMLFNIKYIVYSKKKKIIVGQVNRLELTITVKWKCL